mmetsp:Transcript_66333/g.192181  ORF Transcript_66333/g.192181 Transcript_66333/m.192181 type:complete len:111 (+) Transcript_66333:1633-1965(+)
MVVSLSASVVVVVVLVGELRGELREQPYECLSLAFTRGGVCGLCAAVQSAYAGGACRRLYRPCCNRAASRVAVTPFSNSSRHEYEARSWWLMACRGPMQWWPFALSSFGF